MNNKYKIGEVSKLLGISVDTIRFYEKKNIVMPSKNPETRYRYYNIQDIYTLIDSLFYRKLNISLDNISELMWNSTYDHMKKIIKDKEEDIQNEIKKQNMYLQKLNRLKKYFDLVENFSDILSIRPLKKVYILRELDLDTNDIDNYQSLLELNKEHLDLYNFTCKVFIKNNTLRTTSHYLSIDEEDLINFNLDERVKYKKYLQHKECIYTVIKISHEEYDEKHFMPFTQNMIAYSKANKLNTENYIFINYLLRALENDKHVNYLELFLPIK